MMLQIIGDTLTQGLIDRRSDCRGKYHLDIRRGWSYSYSCIAAATRTGKLSNNNTMYAFAYQFVGKRYEAIVFVP
jgi:hypothetical protein